MEGEKLRVVMTLCVYIYGPGWVDSNPVDIQDTPVRTHNLSVLCVLNCALSKNTTPAQDVDPTANINNYPQTTVDGEQSHDNSATTGFTNDGNIAVAAPARPAFVDRLLQSSSTTNFLQEIATFMAKPTILAVGSLSVSDVIATPLFTLNMPHDGLDASPVFLDKIRGFFGIRCTTCIRWQLNGNRFQQGRYMLEVIPTGGSNYTNTSTAAVLNSWTNTLVQRTQLFRVELDVNCDTEGSLEIPYNSSMNFIPLSSLVGGIGSVPYYGQLFQLRLYAYSPLVSPAGSQVASYTVWVSFKDVELVGPATPQAGGNKSIRGKSTTEKEQDSAGIGPITSGLIRVSSAAKAISAIPLISDYASGVGWFTDILSKATHVFGWSKPLNLAPPHRVTREALPWFGNIDAPDQSQPLALSCQNQVGVVPGFSGTDTDEMDFSFIKTVPCWNQSVSYTTSQTSGTQLFQFLVSPFAQVQGRTSTGGTPLFDFAPHQFIANYFDNWRGSMVYTIKIVKTEFHSGRVAFCYFPDEGYTGGGSITALGDSNYVHREIIDIRLCNEVTFTIPYLSSSPWRPTRGSANFTGTFNCFVVDSLVAPATVSSTITFLVEHSAGPDMEFSIVKDLQQVTPFIGATPQSGGSMNNPMPVADNCELVSGDLGSATVVSDNCLNCLATIGESITSFRSLLKMTNVLQFVGVPAPSLYVNVLPFAWCAVTAGATSDSATNTVGDMYGVLASIFVYSRGGVRLKYLDLVTGTTTTPFITYYCTLGNIVVADMVQQSATNPLGSTNMHARQCNPQVYHQAIQNLASEVQVPQYHRWHSRVNSQHLCSTALPYSTQTSTLTTRYVVAHHYPVVTNTTVCRAGADDTNFGTFVSIPPVCSAVGLQTE